MSCAARVMSDNLRCLMSPCARPSLTLNYLRALPRRGVLSSSSVRRRRNCGGNKRQTRSWAAPNRCFYQLSFRSGAARSGEHSAEECFFFFFLFFPHWKWTKLVRLEVSGDNAAEQRLPFSISTISTQEMSLRERSASRGRCCVQTCVSAETS